MGGGALGVPLRWAVRLPEAVARPRASAPAAAPGARRRVPRGLALARPSPGTTSDPRLTERSGRPMHVVVMAGHVDHGKSTGRRSRIEPDRWTRRAARADHRPRLRAPTEPPSHARGVRGCPRRLRGSWANRARGWGPHWWCASWWLRTRAGRSSPATAGRGGRPRDHPRADRGDQGGPRPGTGRRRHLPCPLRNSRAPGLAGAPAVVVSAQRGTDWRHSATRWTPCCATCRNLT
ncbi:hypothetical protein QJS66_21665 [Kocuria rhizophila]|nr:hypothetical protein QJS66_21665 [Kocuria rhizophila]